MRNHPNVVKLKTIVQLPFDQAAAREAGRIRALLEAQGQMIGPYDVLLAAHVLANRLTLARIIHQPRGASPRFSPQSVKTGG